MDQFLDSSTERMIEEFNQQLKTMAEYHQQACARAAFQRLGKDLVAMNRPPEPLQPPLVQACAWLVRQIATQLEQVNKVRKLSREDAVVVIDAPYTVMTPTRISARKQVQRPEMKSWAK